MKIAQIIGDTVHWVTPYKSLEDVPEYASDVVLQEIQDHVMEGFVFDHRTDQYINPLDFINYFRFDDDNVITEVFKSLENISSEDVVKYDPLEFFPRVGDFWIDDKIYDFKHYVSRRFDEIIDLLNMKKT